MAFNWQNVRLAIAKFRVDDAFASPNAERDDEYIVVSYDGTMRDIIANATPDNAQERERLEFATLNAARACAQYLVKAFPASAFGVYVKGETWKE